MTKPALLALIDRMRQAIVENDSMEARLVYSWEDNDGANDVFGVDAFIRIGNSQGQGGAILVMDGQFAQREDMTETT
jgi:hypothetical protein